MSLPTVEQLRERILAEVPGSSVTVVANPGPSAQHSLLLGADTAVAVATFLRDAPGLRLDFCSNVTGLDWLDREVTEADGKTKRSVPGHLEAVYHLFSMELGHGPVVIRMRTANRCDQVALPSLTPVWRSCEFQEREAYDLIGITFTGHPDLRRLLMWDEFKDHPLRKDYVEPDDYEWEPTPHGDVLSKARKHYPAPPAQP
jgi:NADH-quinone oxidoreductase subunit C